jgi:hypothetical protein
MAAVTMLALAACQGAAESQIESEEAVELPAQEAPAAAEAAPAESSLKVPEAAAPAFFSPLDASPFPPDDIIQAVGYFGGAESGFCDPMSVDVKPRQVTACPADRVEQMGFLALMMDGLAGREAVTLTTTLPDESQISESLKASTDGSLRYEFIPDLADPTGVYRFSFQTSLGDLDKSITVRQASQPRLYVLPEANSLVLRSFSPNEIVRLFLYDLEPTAGLLLRGWSEYQVDEQGSLRIGYSDLDEPYFYIVGEESGLVPYREKGASSLRDMWPGGDIACPGAPQPLSIAFDSSVVVSAQRVLAEVESHPDVFSFPIPQGTKLRLQEFWGAPKCEDRMIWWVVDCPRLPGLDCQGYTQVWVPEGRGKTYYLQPARP